MVTPDDSRVLLVPKVGDTHASVGTIATIDQAAVQSTPSLKLSDLRFDNSFVTQLPADPIKENYCRQVSGRRYRGFPR